MTSLTVRHQILLVAAITLAACTGPPESAPSTALAPSTIEGAGPSTTETSLSGATTVEGPIDLTSIRNSNLQPGIYFVDHDGSPSTSIRAEFTIAEPGWAALRGVYKDSSQNPGTYVAVKFVAVTQVASAACDSTVWVPVSNNAAALASGLGAIEDFVVQVAPTTVNAFGFDGYHLVLEVPPSSDADKGFLACDDGYFDGYEGPTIGRYYQGPNQVVEFWVLDVEGTPLLIEATWFPDSPAEDVAQLQAILATIVIRP